MRFTTTLSGVFALISVAQGLALPEGSSTSPASILQRGPAQTLFCGCGFNMDPHDTDQAVEALKRDFVGQRIGGGFSFHRRVGNTIAFACNRSWRGHAYLPDVNIFSRTLGEISRACGQYIAGSEVMSGSPDQPGGDGFDGEFFYGYQRWEDGHSVNGDPRNDDWWCNNADLSHRSSC